MSGILLFSDTSVNHHNSLLMKAQYSDFVDTETKAEKSLTHGHRVRKRSEAKDISTIEQKNYSFRCYQRLMDVRVGL